MSLAQEQPAARRQQFPHHLGPAADVRQPAERPDPGEDQTELTPAEQVGCGVDITLDERGAGAGARGQFPGRGHGRDGEVQAGH